MRAKRAVTFISLVIISCILLTGCSKPVNPFKEKSTFVPDSAEDKQIEFSLEVIPYFPEEMRRDDMVMYSLTNNSDTEYETGGTVPWNTTMTASGTLFRTIPIHHPNPE